jgi:hypothetical protein
VNSNLEWSNGIQLCPSAQPDMAGSVVIGIVAGTSERPSLRYLDRRLPVTPQLLDTAKPASPTEVFRFAAPCAESACQHYDGKSCQLVERTVAQLPASVNALPPCVIRPDCRWYAQSGAAACFRCPEVVTENYLITPALRAVAAPNSTTSFQV